MTPRHAPGHYLRFDMQHDYVCTKWILDPTRPHPLPCTQGSHQNSECVPPVLIHRAITCDSFKVLAKKKPKRSWVTIKRKDPKSYVLTSSDPQSCPQGNIFPPLYSTLHNIRFDMQVCIKWIWTLRGHTPWPCPKGSHQNTKCVPLILICMAIACESFENLA